MKPRRWYSSPELNPHPTPPAVRPQLSATYLAHAAKAGPAQGPVIRQEPAAPPARRAAFSPRRRPPLRIEAA